MLDESGDFPNQLDFYDGFIVTIVRIVWFVKELIHMYNM